MNLFPITLSDSTVYAGERPLLVALPAGTKLDAEPNGVGGFLALPAAQKADRLVIPLGELNGVARFTSLHRYEPFWMEPTAEGQGGDVPVETQVLLTGLEGGGYALFVPLISAGQHTSLQGAIERGLELVAESGDPAVVANQVEGLYVAAGDDPYNLARLAARAVMARLRTGRLRREKPLPAFVDQFGWCTWNAFYQAVSAEDVRRGLAAFAAGGLRTPLVILDDGWQSIDTAPTGEMRLTALAANEKFPGGLGPLVSEAKQVFGVQTFLVWHALCGYWGGVDETAFPQYDVRPLRRDFSPGILHYLPEFNNMPFWGPVVGVISPASVHRFFHDYHRSLRLQGVDGVKVDNQAVIEGVCAGMGGRVALMQRYHEALEGSAQVHFGGNLINCMSNASEMIYSALNSTLHRSSTDFWPDRPGTHGLHLYTNAQFGLWFGEFVHPDWDMFQSAHPQGAYHAAGRAVSGGPVYVADVPGEHDFDLLRRLVLPDGSTLRAHQPGLPARDCLLHDPTQEDVLLKIFNLNLDAGIVGVFNARYAEPPGSPIAGAVRPADVEGLGGERFAVYAQRRGELRLLGRSEAWPLSLGQLDFELFTIVPVRDGVAPLGLVEMYNSAGAVLAKGLDAGGVYELAARGAGRFALYCERPPAGLSVDGAPVEYRYDPASGWLEFTLSGPGVKMVALRLG
jgi:raffinose synthase